MIEQFDYHFPLKQTMRKIHVYLPPYYYETHDHYPVVYMLDGHNLFRDEYATYKTSWGLESFLDESELRLIIVGIESPQNGEERLAEYGPCPFEYPKTSQIIDGYGDRFMDWVIYHLKPFIDQNYRTLPERESTAIAGSSMGGLMALFTLTAYNRFVSRAACLSPSILFCRDYLEKGLDMVEISPNTRLYISFGENELSFYPKAVEEANYFIERYDQLGADTKFEIQEKGDHNEASWGKLNPSYLSFLFDE